MKKEEVELMIFKVSSNNQDAVNIKVYKNGTVCRNGVGGFPPIGIGGMGFFNNPEIFDKLIAKVPQELLDKPINYEEEIKNGSVEYVIAFYGVSENGETGEHAKWSKSTGIRVKLDEQSQFNHQIMRFLDSLTMDAVEFTNEWYFDVMMLLVHKAKSSTMPETIIASPKTEQEIHNDYENYLNTIVQVPRKWDLRDFVKNKTYEINGQLFKGVVTMNGNSFKMDFVGLDIPKDFQYQATKPQKEEISQGKQTTENKPW